MRFGNLRPSERSDNAALLELFASVPMSGSLVLSALRGPDFFRLYDIQRGVSECWVYERGGRIAGSGTVLVRDGWLEGRAVRVGYLGDLRSSFGASRERGLVSVYGDVIEDTVRRHGCERFLTAVLASNTLAIQALVRRRASRATQPRYTPFRRFAMVSIQFAGRRRRHRAACEVRRATPQDVPAIVSLLDLDHRQRPFGYRFDQGEFEHRLERWPGMTLDRTYVAVDRDGRLVGVTSAWDAAAVRRYRVLGYRGWMRWVQRGWNLPAGLLGYPRLPEPGEDFRYLYLCNTSIDRERPEVLRALLEVIYADFQAANFHFFSLCVYEDDPLAPALSGFLTRRLDFLLYVVTRAGAADDPLPAGRPGFEMALA